MTHPTTESDRFHMLAALGLARRGLGDVWPNPTVGCVIVKDGRVIGRGRTAAGGRPHAETLALAQAGDAARGGLGYDLARGATAYVTLEPCSHHGQTPPCAEALIAAGVARVVIAAIDPDSRVSGRGVERLRQAGVAVEVGLLAEEANEVNAGFILNRTQGRPLVTLKLATSMDGRIATRTGHSQWITGPTARAHSHRIRAQHDAVLVGIGTALADDPELTVRVAGLETRVPVSIVIDGKCSLPITSKLARAAAHRPVWIVTGNYAASDRRHALIDAGVALIDVDQDEHYRLDLPSVLKALGAKGLTRLMVEGGAGLATALMAENLVDRLVWFRSSRLIGGDGLAALGELGLDSLDQQLQFRRTEVCAVGDDLMETYVRI